MPRYDKEKQKAVFLEAPLIEKDYNALAKFFGKHFNEYILSTKTDPIFKDLIRFKNKRVEHFSLGEIPDKRKFNSLIKKLDGLRGLYLDHCQLDFIPSGVYESTNLEYLTIAGNFKLKEVSSKINQLEKLKNFNLSQNRLLSKLPEEILDLENLKELDLWESGVGENNEVVKELRHRRVDVFFNE